MNVVITGGNRGIGLGFVRQYLGLGAEVWACFRSEAGALADIDEQALHKVRWDIGRDDGPVGDLPDAVDLLINNAGIYGPPKSEQSLDRVRPATMLEVFNIDCIGPLRVVQHLLDRFRPGAVIANVSSKMGSVTDNSSGGTYAYRAAKAALVMVSRSMALDLAPRDVHVITLHPGWVRTDMTAHQGLIDVQTSVAGMVDVIGRARDYDPGAFVAFDGSLIPY